MCCCVGYKRYQTEQNDVQPRDDDRSHGIPIRNVQTILIHQIRCKEPIDADEQNSETDSVEGEKITDTEAVAEESHPEDVTRFEQFSHVHGQNDGPLEEMRHQDVG